MAEASALFADLANVKSLIVAVSGGPDSTALLFLTARWRADRTQGPKLLAVTVDHGLRKESRREAAAAKRIATRLGVAHRTRKWTGEKPRTAIQETARTHRYRLLVAEAHRQGARHILTGHTLDDQAETVLFRLIRGSGLSGLAGMARTTPLHGITLIRPLLGIEKGRLLATLAEAGIPFLEDTSNEDPRFARAWLRRLMPELARRGLDKARLARFAARAERAERALDWATKRVLARLYQLNTAQRLAVDRAALEGLPDEIVLRMFHRAISQVGEEPPHLGKLEALVAALLGSRPNGCLRRTLAGAMITAGRDRIVFEAAPPRRALQNRTIPPRGKRRR